MQKKNQKAPSLRGSVTGKAEASSKRKTRNTTRARRLLRPFGPRNDKVLYIIILLSLLLPIFDHNAYHIDVLVTAGIFMMLALGLNVIVGSAGILNLGYGALFAIGAYTYALVNIHVHIPFWIGLWISAFSAAFFGMVLAFPALRLSGDYIAMVTLGTGEIVRIMLNNLDHVTGGPNGLLGIDHPTLWFSNYDFGVHSEPYYFLVFVLLILIVFVLKRIESSRLGRAWVALREDELAASCMGISPVWAKLSAFGIGGFIAGIAGAVFASKQGTVSPDSFDFVVSVMVLAMVVLGGLGNIAGVMIGALALSLLPELLRGFDLYRMLLFGLAMIIIMLFRPQGILGEIHHREEFKERESVPSS